MQSLYLRWAGLWGVAYGDFLRRRGDVHHIGHNVSVDAGVRLTDPTHVSIGNNILLFTAPSSPRRRSRPAASRVWRERRRGRQDRGPRQRLHRPWRHRPARRFDRAELDRCCGSRGRSRRPTGNHRRRRTGANDRQDRRLSPQALGRDRRATVGCADPQPQRRLRCCDGTGTAASASGPLFSA